MTFGRRGAVDASGPAGSQEQSALAVDRNTHRGSAGVAWRLPLAVGAVVLAVGLLSIRALEHDPPQASLASPPANAVETPEAGVGEAELAGFPNTRIEYYDVMGADIRSIQAALAEAGPIDPVDHERVHALTSWRISWRWPSGPDGRCNLSAATASFEANVLLPRLADDRPLAPDLQAAWMRYIGALRLHEAGHLRRAHDRLDDVARAVRSSSCATANAAGERILNEIRRDQAQYDAATQHGRTQGAVLR